MKKFYFTIICIFMAFSLFAQIDYAIPQSEPANNGELEWLVYNTKKGEVKIGKKGVLIKSKLGKRFGISQPGVTTFANIPINMNGDFYLSMTFKPKKVDEEHPIGVVIDATGVDRAQSAIVFDGQFCWIECQGIVKKKTLYKFVKSKKDLWTVSLERKNGGEINVSLNGLEILTLPDDIDFKNPAVGAFVINKNEILIEKVAYIQYESTNVEE